VGKPEGKRPLGLPRHRWEDNIKVDLRGDWINLAQGKDRWRDLVNPCNESSGFIKCGEFLVELRTGEILKKNSAPWIK
jgi:hypothetical protein